jgi:hypothetical protein
MKLRPAMSREERQSIVPIRTQIDADPMSARTPQLRDPTPEGDADSPPGWSSSSISKWDEAKPDDGHCDRIRLWRRRALSKRGARLHTKMAAHAQLNSLAMLDETGIVVCWYGSPDGSDYAAEEVVDRHVSVFYVSEEVSKRQPYRDLRAAVVNGRLTRRAWRRRRDGSAYLGSFDIAPVVLRDGRVQGFSYIAGAPA